MTVVSTTSRWTYNGDSSTTAFPYDNLIFASSDLQVFVDDALQTLNTDYTVSGVGDNGGGSVTFTSAPASGTANVLIVRDVPSTQETDLPEGGPFPSESVEDALDKLTVLVQQLDDLLSNKALALDALDPATSIGRLPLKSTLGNMFLAFDADGNPVAAAGTSANLGPVTPFVDTVLDDPDAATFRATLELGALAILDTLTTLSQNVALTGIITPTQITASQNNYNPTDLATASTLRLSSDASRNITGLQGGASGRILVLHNVGANNIVLVDESVSSDAANRFALPGNITFGADEVVVIHYDATSTRWRCLGKSPGVLSLPNTDGNDGQVLKTDGAGALSFSDDIVSATAQATTSGTAFDFTSIPSWVKKITVMFNGVSLSGTDSVLVQIGDSGGIESSGYIARSNVTNNTTSQDSVSSTAGFAVFLGNASLAAHGSMTLSLVDASTNTWVASSAGYLHSGTFCFFGGGSKALSATLDRVRVTGTGANTFDAGSVNILYEG